VTAQLTGAAIGRFLLIVFIFALVGPPLGALVVAGAVMAGIFGATQDPEGAMWIGAFLSLFGIVFSWVLGIVPAVTAGLIIGARQAFFSAVPFWYAAVTGLVVGLFTMPFVLDEGVGHERYGAPLVILVCLLPTLALWAMVKALRSAAPSMASRRPSPQPGGWNT
jgi:hypothetical protein